MFLFINIVTSWWLILVLFDLESELEVLDTSLIISSGRRTRGNKIDYKQFGADPEDEE
jgi:hypothetical protein